MTQPTGGAPKRGPGRPRRADGLAPQSEAAQRAKGLRAIKVRIPEESAAIWDEIVESIGGTRATALVVLIGLGVGAGFAPRAAEAASKKRWVTGRSNGWR